MKKLIVGICILFSFVGCSYSISEINVSDKDASCVRECSKTYSYSISQGNQIGFKTETLRAAKEAYVICTSTCPLK